MTSRTVAKTFTLVPPPRDRWGRPIIGGRAYTRASSLGKFVESEEALVKWKLRMALIGVTSDAIAVDEVRALTPDDKAELNRLVDEALDRAKAGDAARRGTLMHTATEKFDLGLEAAFSDETEEFVACYDALLRAHHLTPLAAELFVVDEELQVAGSLDRLLQGPRKAVIGDLKSSGVTAPRYSGISWATQIGGVYAHARPYCHERGLLEWADLDLPEPSKDVAVVMHVPAAEPQRAGLYRVDVKKGRELARLACAVRDARTQNNLIELLTPQVPDTK